MSRRSSGRSYVYGRHAVASLLDSDPAGIREIWLLADRADEATRDLESRAAAAGAAVKRVPRKTLDRLAADGTHQGVVVRYRAAAPRTEADLAAVVAAAPGPVLLLVLDGVDDPHNLGACLRSAAAAGAHAVVVPRSRGAGLTPVVHKVASGATERVPLVTVPNLARALAELADAGVQVIGTAADAAGALYDVDLAGPTALVLGGEATGLRRLTRERCDVVAAIPMHGPMESLNVSVAAGVALFEAVRQRRTTPR